MSTRSVYLRLHQNRIYFNDHLSIPVENSNLPFDEIDFNKINNVFWEAEQHSYHPKTTSLAIRIINYFPREITTFQSQNPKSQVNYIEFLNLHGIENLKYCLLYYGREMQHLDEALENGAEVIHSVESPAMQGFKRKNPLFHSRPEQEKVETSFDIWFKDAFFKLGYVSFDKNIPKIKQMASFKVINDFLLPEFELIKSYFIKALGTRKFDVKATVYLEKGKITKTHATSQVIRKINETLIDSIKNIRTLALIMPPFKANVDKSLFSPEEIFDEFSWDDKEGNVFNQSEEEILKYILEKANVRNRKQLEYLSGTKQAQRAKLKFTLSPFFGFLFTVEGERMNHFIWELLNSHATYVWSIDKDEEEMKIQYRRVEDAINQVRIAGRETYKSAYRSSHIDQDLVFNVIKHEDVNSQFIEGFVKWKHRINELLI